MIILHPVKYVIKLLRIIKSRNNIIKSKLPALKQ